MVMKFCRDTWLVFQRAVGHMMRTPTWLLVMLLQPLAFLYLFGPLLRNSLRGVPPGRVLELYIPGLMVQLAIFSTLTAGFSLTGEIRYGVVERFRVTPISGFALLLGRSLRDVMALIIQEVLLVVFAVPLGLRIHPASVIAMMGIMALLALALAPLSYSAAMRLKRDEALGPLVNMVTLPLLLLSGILIPMSYGPGWLQGIAQANPISYVVDGGRQLFAGNPWNGTVGLSVLVPGVLAVVTLTLAGQLFQRSAA